MTLGWGGSGVGDGTIHSGPGHAVFLDQYPHPQVPSGVGAVGGKLPPTLHKGDKR